MSSFKVGDLVKYHGSVYPSTITEIGTDGRKGFYLTVSEGGNSAWTHGSQLHLVKDKAKVDNDNELELKAIEESGGMHTDVADKIKLPESYLAIALRITSGDRRKDYGTAKENHELIARLWEPVLGVALTKEQVIIAMILVKVARLCYSPKHEDSWVDIAGYSQVQYKSENGL